MTRWKHSGKKPNRNSINNHNPTILILCIAEKPSVARDIANILGATIKRNGYFEGPGDCPYKVTWVFGHLCCLKEPNDYTPLWKRWSLAALPMIPQRFGIKLIDQESSKRQFDVIKGLIAQADEVINCGDAYQEGEPDTAMGYAKGRNKMSGQTLVDFVADR